MLPIQAVPIYGATTRGFLHQWIMVDDEEDTIPTAYGVRILTPPEHLGNFETCYICGEGDCDILTEHGATGSPEAGVPAHLTCQLKGEGILLHRDNVKFVEPETPPLTEEEKALLKMAVSGYRGVCESLITRSSLRDWQAQLRVWDSLAAKLKI